MDKRTIAAPSYGGKNACCAAWVQCLLARYFVEEEETLLTSDPRLHTGEMYASPL